MDVDYVVEYWLPLCYDDIWLTNWGWDDWPVQVVDDAVYPDTQFLTVLFFRQGQ